MPQAGIGGMARKRAFLQRIGTKTGPCGGIRRPAGSAEGGWCYTGVLIFARLPIQHENNANYDLAFLAVAAFCLPAC